MGRPMALNLLRAYPGLVVHSRSHGAYSQMREMGAEIADEPQAVATCELIYLSLPDEAVVHNVLFGSSGIAQWLKPGSIVVDTSTISYNRTLEIQSRLALSGIGFMDAPVSGMVARAASGTLTAMCGASPQVFECVQPSLSSMASQIVHMGDVGSGQLSKLINQLLFDINCAALAEIMPMAVRLGLDAKKITSIVNGGTGRSHASECFLPTVLQGDFANGYPLKHAYKDLIHGAELSAQLGIPLPVLAAATVTYQTALLQGHGNDDKGAMIKVYEQLLGVEFRAQVDQE